MDPALIFFVLASGALAMALIAIGHRGRDEGPGVWELWRATRFEGGPVEKRYWFPRPTPMTAGNLAAMSAIGVTRVN